MHRKVIVLACVSILLVISVSALVIGLFNTSATSESELRGLSEIGTNVVATNFTCHAGSEYAFVFPVEVNLSDGMDSEEATIVARRLYETEMNQTNYEVKSVQSDGDGAWMVFLLWGSGTPRANGELENHSHYFNVHVNATDRTVEYDRCY
jgi:hypothetical protein